MIDGSSESATPRSIKYARQQRELEAAKRGTVPRFTKDRTSRPDSARDQTIRPGSARAIAQARQRDVEKREKEARVRRKAQTATKKARQYKFKSKFGVNVPHEDSVRRK